MEIEIDFEKIDEFLALDNLNENLRELILQYARKSQGNVRFLLALISNIGQESILQAQYKENGLVHAVEDMIHASNTDDNIPPDRYVVKYWRAIYEFYPNAKVEAHSPKAKEFFIKFVEQLKLCKYEIIDEWWATEVVECNDYLKKVLENNP